MRAALLVIILFLLTGSCATGTARFGACDEGAVRLLSDFDGARAQDCRKTGPADFTIVIRPESEPINPSPWYAFDVVSDIETEIGVRLHYLYANHRYAPKVNRNETGWELLPSDQIKVTRNQRSVRISSAIKTGRTRIAAQEVYSVANHRALENYLSQIPGAEQATIGKSVQGENITMIKSGPLAADTPAVIILGRQHPPEVPGALSLEAFLGRMVETDSLAETFRNTFALRIVTLLNPDGVKRGHWRLNANLIDLNRDWGPFTQPETAAVKAEIDALTNAGLKPVLLLDFHATRRDVLYTQPDNAGLVPENFAAKWLARIASRYCGEAPDRNGAMNPGLPTAKSWFSSTYKAPAITVEFGDETDRERIHKLSRIAAAQMMAELLGVEDDQDANPAECSS